jgi:hypothetical protein
MQTQTDTPAQAREEPQKFITKPTLAKRYAVCVRTIEHWITERRIPVIRLGKRAVRFDPLKCDAALARFEVHATGEEKRCRLKDRLENQRSAR